MKLPRKPFRINIGFLINQPIGYTRSLPFEFSEIEIGEGFKTRDLTGKIDLVRTQDGFHAQALFNGKVSDECSRCLEPFQKLVHSEFEEFFIFPHVESSEDEIKVSEDGNVDFESIIYDYFIMELPINSICQPDCKGLCNYCGQNLNHGNCKHLQEQYKEPDLNDSLENFSKNDRNTRESQTTYRKGIN